jgi:hypothetical protein
MSDDLTKNDLKIYMQSYENMILMHKTILDQQAVMTGLLSDIVNNQNKISEKQMKTCSSIQGITTKFNECSEKFTTAGTEIKSTTVKLTNDLISHDKESLKEHNKIKNRLYIAYGLSGTIIMGLVGLIWKFADIFFHLGGK